MIFSLFVHSIYIRYCRFQVFEYGHIFKGFICRFMLWFCPAFYSRNVNMYLVSSEFTCSPIFLLASNKLAVLFIEFMFLPNIEADVVQSVYPHHTPTGFLVSS